MLSIRRMRKGVKEVLAELRVACEIIASDGAAAGVSTDVAPLTALIAKFEAIVKGGDIHAWWRQGVPNGRLLDVMVGNPGWREFLNGSPRYLAFLNEQVDSWEPLAA